MRFVFILLCIFSVTTPSSAQLFGRKYRMGNYYDTLNHKTAGLIAWSVPDKLSKKAGDYIYYKPDAKAKGVKLESFCLKSFTMESDSFVVSKNEHINYAPVLKVLLDGKLKIYYWSARVTSLPMALLGGAVGAALTGGGTVLTGSSGGYAYFYGANPDSLNTITNKNFANVMTYIMDDKPEVVAKIKQDKLRLKDINDLLVFYKTGAMPAKEPEYPYYE